MNKKIKITPEQEFKSKIKQHVYEIFREYEIMSNLNRDEAEDMIIEIINDYYKEKPEAKRLIRSERDWTWIVIANVMHQYIDQYQKLKNIKEVLHNHE